MGAFNRRWVCPLCSLTLRPDDLRRDTYVEQVLASTHAEVEEVLVDSDGSWRLPTGAAQQGPEALPSSAGPPACSVEEPEELVDLDSPALSPAEAEGATVQLTESPPACEAVAKTRAEGGSNRTEEPEKGRSPPSAPRTPARTSSPNGGTRSPKDGGGRPRLLLDKHDNPPAAQEPLAASVEDAGYQMAVKLSLVGGVFSSPVNAVALATDGAAVTASARRRRLAQLELEDDDTSPATKKAPPKRRLAGAPKSKSKRAKKAEAATPAIAEATNHFTEPVKVGMFGTMSRPIDLD
mmetsp:Transcript_7798/g.18011  ORF Transcript_7798/g.18011 Transcript_7798/m.18011 type:complete len:294 (-) Transcript_7798:131-1012(-)